MATGVPPPEYTWFKDGVLIPGETQPLLYIPEVQPNDRGSYKCKATNPLGEVTSEVVVLMIPGTYRCKCNDITIPMTILHLGILQYTAQIEFSISSLADVEQVRL